MSIFIRTVPNVMRHYNCSAEVAQRYIDLREEGHAMHAAALMAGLTDPPDSGAACRMTLEATLASSEQKLREAMRRAFVLGQTYWQQADSEYASQHRKADETRSKFDALVQETVAALQQQPEPPPDLLQMLHECAEYIAALNGEQDDYCQRARALIARATGEVK